MMIAMITTYADNNCRCQECATIHADFIGQFGKWPNMTHAEGQRLADSRRDNLASWERLGR